jgi:hypothetical protein
MLPWLSPETWLAGLDLLFARRYEIQGVPVYVACDLEQPHPDILAHLDAAVTILRTTALRPRHAWGGYVRRVRVYSSPLESGNWINPLRLCSIEVGFLMGSTTHPEDVASVIVHESQHARIMAMGVSYSRPTRLRVERICVDAEIAFAARLPDPTRLTAWLLNTRRNIAYHWDPVRRRERGIAALRKMGTPEWIIRLVAFISRWTAT